MIHVKDNQYHVYADLNTGKRIDLTAVVMDLSWGDPVGELAAKAQFKLANIVDQLDLCTHVQIVANGRIVFEGVIWEKEFAQSKNKELSIVAFDKLIYATKSKDNGYWSAGMSTKSIITDICKKWGLKVDYSWGGITHKKIIMNNVSITDQITRIIEEAERQVGRNSRLIFQNDTVVIGYEGSNSEVYLFTSGENMISLRRRELLEGLVTKVIVVGKANDQGRSAVEKAIEGKTEYGVLQEIVQRQGDTSLDDATKEAMALLEDKGKPMEYLTVELPDIPSIRKGDKIKLKSSGLSGTFIVKGVTHSAADRMMSVELKRLIAS